MKTKTFIFIQYVAYQVGLRNSFVTCSMSYTIFEFGTYSLNLLRTANLLEIFVSECDKDEFLFGKLAQQS